MNSSNTFQWEVNPRTRSDHKLAVERLRLKKRRENLYMELILRPIFHEDPWEPTEKELEEYDQWAKELDESSKLAKEQREPYEKELEEYDQWAKELDESSKLAKEQWEPTEEALEEWAKEIEAQNEAIMGTKDIGWQSYMLRETQFENVEYCDPDGIVWVPRLYDELTPEARELAKTEFAKLKWWTNSGVFV